MVNPTISYRHPSLEDGAPAYELIKASPPLDVNSQYYYHIVCSDFSETCVIAEWDGELVGFISAYLKPKNTSTLFVWQVVVAEVVRGRGLASNMLGWLTKQKKCRQISCLETTISPSNRASQNLFKRFASENNAACNTFSFLDVSHFDGDSHEDEVLYKISPLT
jgi:diaminobutyrate acetyltransferase